MANRTRSITYFYPKAQSTGYDTELTDKRFSILNKIQFKSILDVGSGCCNLHKWLKHNNYDVVYHAVDIRSDALQLCDCPTFTEIPNIKYDVVCLYGTVTYNINENAQQNKQILSDLLESSKKVANKYIVFTVIKRENITGLSLLQLVSYTKNEIQNIASTLGSFTIDETTHPDEYIIVCEI
jgi:hypothetical protein